MASATVCVRLRVPSFACAFLKWLRTVSSPRPSASAVSCNVRPIDACRNTDCSLGVRTEREPTRFTSSPTSLSKRTAAALASQLGFDPIDAGPLTNARLLEPFGMLWIWLAVFGGVGRDFSLQLVKR